MHFKICFTVQYYLIKKIFWWLKGMINLLFGSASVWYGKLSVSYWDSACGFTPVWHFAHHNLLYHTSTSPNNIPMTSLHSNILQISKCLFPFPYADTCKKKPTWTLSWVRTGFVPHCENYLNVTSVYTRPYTKSQSLSYTCSQLNPYIVITSFFNIYLPLATLVLLATLALYYKDTHFDLFNNTQVQLHTKLQNC